MKAFKLLLILPLLLMGCGPVVTPHMDQYGMHQYVITCVDNEQACDQKAAEICPAGYNVLKERPPTGIGFYYANHVGSDAYENMAYGITVTCK